MAEDWVNAHILRGLRHRAEGHFQEALADLQLAAKIPENLPSDQAGDTARKAEIAYATGLVHDAMGDQEQARKAWEQAAASGRGEPRRGGYAGGSRRNGGRFYAGAGSQEAGPRRRGGNDLPRRCGERRQALENAPKIDPAAAVTVQQTERGRLAQAHYLAGLGALGLGRRDEAQREFAECLKISPDHLGAKNQLVEIGEQK